MLISKSEFARRIGVSPVAVGKAVKSGRLTLLDGRWLDEKVAALQWDLNRKRLPPPKKGAGIGPAVAVEADEQPICWDVENTGVWITMTRNRSRLPHIVENWLSWAVDCPVNPILVERLVNLLEDIADSVERIRNPEPDE